MNKDLLYKFFQGFSTELEKKEIRSWMESSDSNRKQYYHERKLFDLLMLQDNSGSTRKSNIKKYTLKYSWIKEALKIAAIVLVAFLGVNAYYVGLYGEKKAIQIVDIPSGQRIKLTLSDGTKVWLNSNSRLSYPAYFSRNQRKVKLEGEAYFEVSHNKKRPFIVETAEANVEVLGTKFNIRVDAGRHLFTTALLEGAVALTKGEEKVVLNPGQEACLQKDGFSVNKIQDYEVFRWREGLVCFADKTFSYIIKQLEKAFGVSIVIDEQISCTGRFSGKIRIADGVSNALKVMQRLTTFTVEYDESSSTVYLKKE